MGKTNFPNGITIESGVSMVAGVTALDGTNPTPIVTGLTLVTGFSCALAGNSTPGVGTSVLTYEISAGTVNVYAWKVTNSSTTTLIASTGTENVSWVAFGT